MTIIDVSADEGGVLHAGLQCRVRGVSYNFVTQRGMLDLDEGSCCDMEGAIALFVGIDPSVSSINTYSDSKLDTAYKKRAGEWIAA